MKKKVNATYLCMLMLLLSMPTLVHADMSLTLSPDNMPPAFSAKYAVKIGGMSMGALEVTLIQDDESNWTYQSQSSASGLASIFVGSNNVTDTAKLTLFDNVIRPTFYERIRKTKEADKSERVFYRWDQLQAKSEYKDRKLDVTLDDLTTDKFTLQLLIMANVNDIPEKIMLPIISKAKLKQYEIINKGTAALNTIYGQRETIIIERVKDDSSYKIWADPNNYGLPLQIERIKEGKTEYIVQLEQSSLFQDSEKITTQSMNSQQSSYFQAR